MKYCIVTAEKGSIEMKVEIRFQIVAPDNLLENKCEHCKSVVSQNRVAMHVFVGGICHILLDEPITCPRCNNCTQVMKLYNDQLSAELDRNKMADEIDKENEINHLNLEVGSIKVIGGCRVFFGGN